jgi:hypothetical protein
LVQLIPHLTIVYAHNFLYTHFLGNVMEILRPIWITCRWFHSVSDSLVITKVRYELIENMKISLSWRLTYDSAFLQEIVLDGRVVYLHCSSVDFQTDQLSKSARIVIFYCFRITKHFENGVAFQDHCFHIGSFLVVHVQHSTTTKTYRS